MNALDALKARFSKLLRGPWAASQLRTFGIDPYRYWLLVDLFSEVSERGEMLDQLGRNGVALGVVTKIYFALSIFFSLAIAYSQPSVTAYFALSMLITAFFFSSILLSETANTLVNPAEALILAHQPINGATYTAAKLSHISRIVLYMAPGTSAAPAIIGLWVPGARWYYPFLHLGAAFALGFFIALVACALFGWILRFIPVSRVKAAAQFIGTLPLLLMAWTTTIEKFVRRLHVEKWLPSQPSMRWGLAAAAGASGLAAVVIGLRALSGDYLIRVSGLMRGGASIGSGVERSFTGAVISRFFGGQAARAAFAFVSRMMLRDWQFRRQFFPLFLVTLLGLGSAAAEGWPVDPLQATTFSAIHVVPHILGAVLLMICVVLPYGADYKGAWMFLLAPARAIDGFASGIFATLWIEVLVFPHLVLFPLLAWRWGLGRAGFFLAFSLAASSEYLAVELRLIGFLPFSKQVDQARQSLVLPALITCGIVGASAAGIQYLLIFRSPELVAGTTIALAGAAYFTARSSIRSLAASIRYHLGLESSAAGDLYKEIAA